VGAKAAHRLFEIADQIPVGPRQGGAPGHQNVVVAGSGRVGHHFAGHCPEAPPGAVSRHRVAHLAARGEPHPGLAPAVVIAAWVMLEHL